MGGGDRGAVLYRPGGGQNHGHLADAEGPELGLGHRAVDHGLGGPDVLDGHLSLHLLLGQVRGAVEELYGHPGVPVLRGVLRYEVQRVRGYPARVEGLLGPGLHDLPQLPPGVAVELHGVGPAEGGLGSLVQVGLQGLLGDQDHGHGGVPGGVGPGELVDHVHGPPLQEHVHLVQDHHQPACGRREVGDHRPGHLVHREAAVRVPFVVVADDLQQHPRLGGVAAVDHYRVHRPPGLGHVVGEVGQEPAGRGRLAGSDAACEERGAGPPGIGQGPEQGLHLRHLALPVDQVPRDVGVVQLGPVAYDGGGPLEHVSSC